MSLSNDNINITNINEIEEGELSETNINNQEILKLIEDKRKEINEKTSIQKSIFQTKNEVAETQEEIYESDNNETGFFHNMNVPNNNQIYLNKKKKNLDNTNEQLPKEDSNGKLRFNNKNRQNLQQQKKGKTDIKLIQQKNNKKRLICNYYINGACHKGNECTFSHDTPQIKKPNELCKFFITNNCSKGDDCLYSHNTSSFPCKYFHSIGFCEKGTECRFSHSRLSEEEIKTFIETNEDFMNQLYKHNGTTNMNDYYFQYIKEKKSNNIKEYLDNLKVPSSAMLPPTTNLLNVNQVNNHLMQRTLLPQNIANSNMNIMIKGNSNNPMFNGNFYPNMARNPLMFHPQMQMHNFLMKNKMNPIGNINPMMNKIINPININYGYNNNPMVGNFLQKINPFELQPKLLNKDNIENPSEEDEIGNGNKAPQDNENSFEEIIEECEKQESIFNPSVDAKDFKEVKITNKNKTIENLSKVLKIVQILKKNPADTTNEGNKDDVSCSRIDPRLKKKN